MVALWIGAQVFDNAAQDDHDPADQGIASLLEAIEIPDWQRDALCREYPAGWWFPERGQSVAPAKDVCSRCLVAEECAAYADELPDWTAGVWAGTTQRARTTERRARRQLGIVA